MGSLEFLCCTQPCHASLSWKVLTEGSKLPHSQKQWEVGQLGSQGVGLFWGGIKEPSLHALFKDRSAALGSCGWQEHVWMSCRKELEVQDGEKTGGQEDFEGRKAFTGWC